MAEQALNAKTMQTADGQMAAVPTGNRNDPNSSASNPTDSDNSPAQLEAADVNLVRGDKMGRGAVRVARKVAAAYCKTEGEGETREHAEAIISEWMERGEETIRATLATQLADCPFLPPQLVQAMASDVGAVAAVILEKSEALTEDDLSKMVDTGELAHRMAIAARRFVPHLISDSLIDQGEKDVAIRLLENEGAKLSEPALHRIMDEYNKNTDVVKALTERGRVPSSVADRIVALLAEPPVETAERPHPLFARTIGMAKPKQKKFGGINATELADQVAGAGRLTPAFLLRALCDDRRSVFEAGIARLAGLPVGNTIGVLISGSEEHLSTLFKRAGVPEPFRRAFHQGIEVLLRDGEYDPESGMSYDQVGDAVLEVFKNDDTLNLDEYKAVLLRLYELLERKAGSKKSDPKQSGTGAADAKDR